MSNYNSATTMVGALKYNVCEYLVRVMYNEEEVLQSIYTNDPSVDLTKSYDGECPYEKMISRLYAESQTGQLNCIFCGWSIYRNASVSEAQTSFNCRTDGGILDLYPVSDYAVTSDYEVIQDGKDQVLVGYTGASDTVEVPYGITKIALNQDFHVSEEAKESVTQILIPATVSEVELLVAGTMFPRLGAYRVNESSTRYESDNQGILYEKNRQRLVRTPAVIHSLARRTQAEYVWNIPDTVTAIDTEAFEDSIAYLDARDEKLTVALQTLTPPEFTIRDTNLRIQVPESDDSVITDQNIKTYAATWGSMIDHAADQTGYALANVLCTASGAEAPYHNAGNLVYSIIDGQKVLEYAPVDAPEDYTLDTACGITAINAYAFNGATKTAVVHIPESITTFMSDCFVTPDQQRLAGVVIDQNQTATIAADIAGDESERNPYLHIFISEELEETWKEQIDYQDTDTYLIADSGTVMMKDHCLYLKNDETKMTTLYSVQQDGTSYSAPEELTAVGSNAFVLCPNLTEIVLPNVTKLDENAFNGCEKLEILVMESTEQIAVKDDLSKCPNLKMVLAYAANANEAFADCAQAQVITDDEYIHENGMIYQYDAMNTSYCVIMAPSDIEGIVELKNNTTAIGEGAFAGCEKFEGFSQEQWNKIDLIDARAFDGCSRLAGSLTLSAKQIEDQAFRGCNALTQLYLNTGIEMIGDDAFGNCTSLRYLYWIADTTTVGDRVFKGCSVLSNVTIGDTPTDLEQLDESTVVTSIGNYTFQNCTNIVALVQHTSIRKIGDYSFDGCEKLQLSNDNFTDGTYANVYTQSIGAYAFQGCKELRDGMHDMNNLKVVGVGAFKDCISIGVDTIPEQVSEISDYCYMGCEKLQRIYFATISTKSNKIRSIGKAAFSGCTILNRAYFLDAQDSFEEIGDYAFSSYQLGEKTYEACANLQNIQMPANILRIGEDAFKDNVLLDSVSFTKASKLQEIAAGAFENCASLQDAYLTNTSISVLEEDTFKNCSSLMTMLLPDDCEMLRAGALEGCDALQVMLLQNRSKIVSIDAGALGSAGDNTDLILFVPQTTNQTLKQDYITDSSWNEAIGARGEEILREIPAGDNVLIDGAGVYVETNTGAYTLSAVFPSASGSLQMRNDTTAISEDAFNGCSHLTLVVFSYQAKTIPEGAFAGCDSLEAIVVNERLLDGETFKPLRQEGKLFAENETERTLRLYVEENTMSYYTSSGSFDIRSFGSGMRVDSDVLYGRFASETDSDGVLSLLYVPRGYSGQLTLYQGTEAVVAEAAKDCTHMTAVNIVASVRDIGDLAFSGCTSLQTAFLHNETGTALKTIGREAFAGCSALIGRNASYANRITIPLTVTSVGAGAFKDCSSLTYISLQGKMTEIADETFSGCTNLTTFQGSATQLAIITRIGKNAFYNNKKLVSLSWTNMMNLTEVADSAYEGCSNIILATFADKLTKIGSRAFYGTNMKSISFNGATPPELGSEIMTGDVINQIHIYVPLGDEGQAVVDRYKSGWQSAYPTLVDKVQGLDGKAFRMVSNVLYIVNPDDSAELTAVKVPNTLSTVTFYNTLSASTRLYCIGLADDSLSGCNLLTQITVTNNIRSIGARAFADCSALVTVDIQGNVLTSIGNNAFANCASLQNLTLPTSVNSLGDGMLDGIPNFATLELKSVIPASLGSKIFGATLPDNLKVKVPFDEAYEYYEAYIKVWGNQIDEEYGEGTAKKIFYAKNEDGTKKIENGIKYTLQNEQWVEDITEEP